MKKTIFVLLLVSFVLSIIGVVDIVSAYEKTGAYERTRQDILPMTIKIRITSPNGGEIWNRKQVHNISWNILANERLKTLDQEIIYWPKASIDLYKIEKEFHETCETNETKGDNCLEEVIEKSVFVKHITSVNLFDGNYKWEIDKDIPDGDNYVIRISAVPPCSWSIPKESELDCLTTKMPIYSYTWDESDDPFTITGKTLPPTDLIEVIEILEETTMGLKKTIDELLKAIEILKGLILEN